MSEEENINLNEVTPEAIKAMLSSDEEQNRDEGLRELSEAARRHMTPEGFRQQIYPVLAFMAHDEDTDMLIPAALTAMKGVAGVGAVLRDDGSGFLKLLAEVTGDVGVPAAIRGDVLRFLVDVYCADLAASDAPTCAFYRTRLFPVLAAAARDESEEEPAVRRLVPGLVARSVMSPAVPASILEDMALPLLENLTASTAFEVRNEVASALPTVIEVAAARGETSNTTTTTATEEEEEEKEATATATAMGNRLVEAVCKMFLTLCQDSVWNVRRACVEGMVRVGAQAPQRYVVDKLTGVVRRYLSAEEEGVRWVYVAMYRALGEFLCLIEAPEDIPADLLGRFLAMAEVEYAQHVGDSDLRLFCAYSFPGVLTKVCGSDPGAWEDRFRAPYELLAKDLQYRVRRSLACSIHEVAALVPPAALAPTFNALAHDIDQVRFGCLPNLARFLACFPAPAERRPFLSILNECLEDDNWRTRKCVAKQLGDIAALFPGTENTQTIRRIHELFFELSADPVAKVRHFAALSVSHIHTLFAILTVAFAVVLQTYKIHTRLGARR